MMHYMNMLLLVTLALSSATAESIEACSTSTDINGTCAAKAAAPMQTDGKALALQGYLQLLADLRAKAEEMWTAPCTAGSEPHFRIAEGAQDRCPEGSDIASFTECRDAIQALGLEAQMKKYTSEGVIAPNVLAWSVVTRPMGCSHPSTADHRSFGVFNSDEAGKGDERVSLICRTSAWTPSPDAAADASEWSGAYKRLEGGDGCPEDSEIASAAECAAAIGSLDLESHDVIEGHQSYRPSGCSYLKDGRPGFPKRGLFNTWKDGKEDLQFDPICRKFAYEEADREDNLEAEDRDFARLSMGAVGFAGGLSKS